MNYSNSQKSSCPKKSSPNKSKPISKRRVNCSRPLKNAAPKSSNLKLNAKRRDSYWIAAYFKETQLRHISTGDTAIISLMGNEDLPFRGTVRSMGCGIFVPDGSSGQSTALLPSVSPTIDWVRLPQRFPVRIQVDSSAPTELRIGQAALVAISHGARIENTRIPE